MGASVGPGLGLDLEDSRRVMSEIVSRRLVDELRVPLDGQLLCVQRGSEPVVTAYDQDHRGSSLTWDNVEQFFSDTDILVPRLKVRDYALTFRLHADLVKATWGKDTLWIRRLEDVSTEIMWALQKPRTIRGDSVCLQAVWPFLAQCAHHGILCRIFL